MSLNLEVEKSGSTEPKRKTSFKKVSSGKNKMSENKTHLKQTVESSCIASATQCNILCNGIAKQVGGGLQHVTFPLCNLSQNFFWACNNCTK